MAATTLFSGPISPHQYPKNLWQPSSQSTKSALFLLRASSPTSTVDKEEEESSSIPFGGCKACGKAEIERGCNGEGRMQGGIATVPGFGWWPIKAYRPCPDFVATGGRYRRQGQSMDEVAGFGSVPRTSPTPTPTPTPTPATQTQSQSSKKEGR